MQNPKLVARYLAEQLAYGSWRQAEMVDRGAEVFGRRQRWMPGLVKRLLSEFPAIVSPETAAPDRAEIEQFLLGDCKFITACGQGNLAICIATESRPPLAMAPGVGRPETWRVPPLVTVGELSAFLGTTPSQLYWLADRFSQQRAVPDGPLRHYRYHWRAKRVGGSARLIEEPKWRLKMAQRKILHAILDQIPVHFRAHGFCRGRSTRSYVEPHVGREVVLRTDLRDFFPSITSPRIYRLFSTAGYPSEIASLLAALCTNSVPDDVWASFPQFGSVHDRLRHEGLLRRPHLPQGAPTSPALANLVAYRLDCRLMGLSRRFGARYTRYADDLLFSGGRRLRRASADLLATVGAVVLDEGFCLNTRKNRVMCRSTSQTAAGLTLNQHVNTPRREFEQLKATLHNCVRHGPASQNRSEIRDFQAHLRGRVAYVERMNPQRGKRLRELYECIVWS